MASTAPLQPGDPAPDFTLRAVDSEGTVSLAEYRGRAPVLLAFERGLWCAFCRRHLARLSAIREKLASVGVETLAILATEPERARLYLQYHPIGLPLAADPGLESHHSYGLHNMSMSPMTIFKMLTGRFNPTGELPKPLPVPKIAPALNRIDNFEPTEIDKGDAKRQQAQLVGQFLVDRHGIVRWANIEGQREGLAGIGKLPSEEEFLAAAHSLPQ
jgi:peroxiredoxin